jgi:hypothetical protein
MTLRIHQAPEPIEMHGHQARCRYCHDGIVKMARNERTLALEPDQCWCLLCGQPYFVVIDGDLHTWEARQWQEKADPRS